MNAEKLVADLLAVFDHYKQYLPEDMKSEKPKEQWRWQGIKAAMNAVQDVLDANGVDTTGKTIE